MIEPLERPPQAFGGSMTLEQRYAPLIHAILTLLDGANLTKEPYRTNTAIRLILLFDEYYGISKDEYALLKQLLNKEEHD